MRLSPEDHAKVTAAVTAAEAHTDGEIVTVVARASDRYDDVALLWASFVVFAGLAWLAIWPGPVERTYALIDPWSPVAPIGALFGIALVAVAVKFLGTMLILRWRPLRLALTPAGIKTARVRNRALMLFRTGAEKRTIAATGVLLYLSLEEHRAELIADESIHWKVPAETWGAAMAALVAAVKDGRPGDGMAEAVAQIGVVLAEHFPRSEGDTNELPDRLIEL